MHYEADSTLTASALFPLMHCPPLTVRGSAHNQYGNATQQGSKILPLSIDSRSGFITCWECTVGGWETPPHLTSAPHPVPFVVGLHPFGSGLESLPQNMMWEVFKDRRWQKSAAVAKSAGISTTQATLRWMWFDQINLTNVRIWTKNSNLIKNIQARGGYKQLGGKGSSQYVAMFQKNSSFSSKNISLLPE